MRSTKKDYISKFYVTFYINYLQYQKASIQKSEGSEKEICQIYNTYRVLETRRIS